MHRSVVHFVPTNLARAIYDVANGDTTHVKARAEVVSIAMGGPPTFGLWRAVKTAQNKGILVIAAAGNYVGFVVWPARFSEVISVSATNNKCGLWQWASTGNVDIAAPGEDVMRADVSKAGDFRVCTGSGTTFGTAAVSGFAALWLEYLHRTSDNQLKALRESGQLTAAFRAALQHAAWKPSAPPSGVACANTSWSDETEGPGIIDGKSLLSPITFGTRETPTTSTIPLFQSLIPSTSADLVELKYRKLFGLQSTTGLGDVEEFESEILFHYYQHPGVREALDAFVSDPASGSGTVANARNSLLQVPTISDHLRRALLRVGGGDNGGVP